jgi:hypothetical protein
METERETGRGVPRFQSKLAEALGRPMVPACRNAQNGARDARIGAHESGMGIQRTARRRFERRRMVEETDPGSKLSPLQTRSASSIPGTSGRADVPRIEPSLHQTALPSSTLGASEPVGVEAALTIAGVCRVLWQQSGGGGVRRGREDARHAAGPRRWGVPGGATGMVRLPQSGLLACASTRLRSLEPILREEDLSQRPSVLRLEAELPSVVVGRQAPDQIEACCRRR